jgi:hypothetical protein
LKEWLFSIGYSSGRLTSGEGGNAAGLQEQSLPSQSLPPVQGLIHLATVWNCQIPVNGGSGMAPNRIMPAHVLVDV